MKRFSSAALLSALQKRRMALAAYLQCCQLWALAAQVRSSELDLGAEGSIPTPCRILAVAVGQMTISQVLNSPNP